MLKIPNQIAYVVSQGAMNQLANVIALVLADKGVWVNAVGPGPILTDRLKTVMTDEAALQKILSRKALGRSGEPEDIAKVIAFLASDDASYFAGQSVYPDAGRLGLNYRVAVPNNQASAGRLSPNPFPNRAEAPRKRPLWPTGSASEWQGAPWSRRGVDDG